MKTLARIGHVLYRTAVIIVAFTIVFVALQSVPQVRHAEAQLCGFTGGSTLSALVGVCQAVGQIFQGGIQVGAFGFPISEVCAVTATMNGATEVDVTPTCALPTSTAPSAAKGVLSEVLCTGFGSGAPIVAWIKNATQIAISGTSGDTRTASCVAFAH